MRFQRSSIWFFTLAWVAFVISFFLPAEAGMAGWQAAATCAQIFISPLDSGIGGWLYYGLFTVANFLVIISPVLLAYSWRKDRTLLWFRITSFALILYVLSLDVISRGGGDSMGIGYYLWTISFILLAGGLHVNAKEICASRQFSAGTLAI